MFTRQGAQEEDEDEAFEDVSLPVEISIPGSNSSGPGSVGAESPTRLSVSLRSGDGLPRMSVSGRVRSYWTLACVFLCSVTR